MKYWRLRLSAGRLAAVASRGDVEKAHQRASRNRDKALSQFPPTVLSRQGGVVHFDALAQRSETGEMPHAEIVFTIDGREVRGTSDGNGPVDAIFNAIKSLYPHEATLALFDVHAVTEGTDAQAGVTVRLTEDGRSVTGRSADTDTLVSAAKAYVHALNKLLMKRQVSSNEAITAAR